MQSTKRERETDAPHDLGDLDALADAEVLLLEEVKSATARARTLEAREGRTMISNEPPGILHSERSVSKRDEAS